MKNISNLLFKFLITSMFSFCCSIQTFGQEKVNISVGMGLPELLNVGVRFQLEQAQIGVSFGSIPIQDESLISVSADFYYHFAGLSKLSSRRPWYGRIGLNSLRNETSTLINKSIYLNLRMGRDINFSKKFGAEIDAGGIFLLSHQTIIKSHPSGWNFSFPILATIGIGLFYRI